MTARAAAGPPEIPGFTAIELIGVGGYADVFLYEQHKPRRRVAVKVMTRDALNTSSPGTFAAEADLMARVSAHPYIVSVFHADITAEGRPFIVMEHYPGANYLDRVRREHFNVAEVLRTGIHIASAVETAHRAGILHRDIKPANILTSEYGRPGLTDFGIAGDADTAEAEGMSVPWAPPEAFGNSRLDERSDVYSLAATVYHLLVGRSPFEIAGGANGALDLMGRIEKQRMPDLQRADVPMSLSRTLAQALAKQPEQRPASAAEFARRLQAVEAELNLAVTPLELADGRPSARLRTATPDDDATRIRGVHTIDPQAPTAMIDVVPDSPAPRRADAPPRPREGLLAEPEPEETVVRPKVASVDAIGSPPTVAGRPRWLVPALGAAAVLVAAVLGALALSGGKPKTSDDSIAESVNDGVGSDGLAVAEAPGVVTGLAGTSNPDGTYTFSWSPPVSADRDVAYQVTEVETAEHPREAHPPQAEATFVSQVPCVEVAAVLDNLLSAPTPKCAGV